MVMVGVDGSSSFPAQVGWLGVEGWHSHNGFAMMTAP